MSQQQLLDMALLLFHRCQLLTMLFMCVLLHGSLVPAAVAQLLPIAGTHVGTPAFRTSAAATAHSKKQQVGLCNLLSASIWWRNLNVYAATDLQILSAQKQQHPIMLQHAQHLAAPSSIW